MFRIAVTLIGSLLTIYVQNKSGSINLNSNSVFKIYEDLLSLHINAEQNLSELTIYSSVKDGLLNPKLSEVMTRSNELCVEVRKLIGKV